MVRVLNRCVAVVLLLGGWCVSTPSVATEATTAKVEIVTATRFVLDHAYRSEMRSDQPEVSEGWLIVVRADPELTVPRQSQGPLLFAGEWPLETMNTGESSGTVVAIVPSSVDFADTPIHFARAESLPESMTAAEARSLVATTNTEAPDSKVVKAALDAGGPPLHLAGQYQLHLAAADLIERFAPSEREAVDALRAPFVQSRRSAVGEQNHVQGTTSPSATSPEKDLDRVTIPGLVLTELAGNSLNEFPFFEYVRAFNAGSPVQVALDPGRFPVAGQESDIYLVQAKSPDEWLADPSLIDVSSSGPETVSFTAGTIQSNTFTVDTGTLIADAGTGIGVAYDIVVDLDRNGQLSSGDLIDGSGHEAGMYVVHDLTQPGPLSVTETTYSGGAFLGQNLFYPTDIASMGQLPLVVVSHGNGHYYLWYDHIGQHLASYGFIVMSHQNNTQPGIESASTTTLTNTDYFLGHLDTIEGGVLDGHVDSHNIVWIGHSRGGEGIIRAYDRIYDGDWVPSNYSLSDLVLLSSMAPTNYLGADDSNPHNAPYHVWFGGADADVVGCPVYDHRLSLALHDRAEGHRQSISLHGVGHGDFHNSGGSSVATGPCLLGRSATHTLMRGYLLPLVSFYTLGNLPAEDFLWRQWERFRPIGAPTSDCVVVDLTYRPGQAAGKFVIDDFQSGFPTNESSSGGTVQFTVSDLTEALLDDANTTLTHNAADPMNGMTVGTADDLSRGIVFTVDSGSPQSLEFDLVPGKRDLSGWTYISLRAAQATRHPLTTAEHGDATFTVSLVDGTAVESSINIGAYGGGLEEPYQRSGCGIGTGWANEFETVRLRLSDFLHNGTGLDLKDVHKVLLRFGPGYGSSAGRFGLDQLELLGPTNRIFADGFENGDASAWESGSP